MNKLSKEKKTQLVAAVLGTLTVITALYMTLIRFQRDSLQTVISKQGEKQANLERTLETIKNSKQIEADLLVVSNKLYLQEEDMASGDLYSSMYDQIRKFKQSYEVDIPQFNSSGVPQDMTLLPKFPYKQTTMTVAGTGYYYDFGQFVADFENRFPTARILNVELSPASAQNPDEKEKLQFRMDIVELVKPGARQ